MPIEEGGTNRPTLVRPAPDDPTKAPIENVLDVLELGVFGPDIFTNARPIWHPPGARGVYGGAMIAMCLAAGHKTVPDHFAIHSCHCYFILAGSAEIPVLFHVEKVRDGKSFATRTVQARQRGRCIFTTTMSFVKESQPEQQPARLAPPSHEFKDNVVRHAVHMPTDPETGEPVRPPPDDYDDEPGPGQRASPFQSYGTEVVGYNDGQPHQKKLRQWYRARGKISEEGGHQAHLNALSYISDSYFIGTVSRIHRLWRFPFPPREFQNLPKEIQNHVRRLNDFEGFNPAGNQMDFEEFAGFWKDRPEIGMMVSLDHSIYFHEPRKVRADEWILSEMESPWAGDGRGVVTQRIFSADGTLLATCFQEGVVRLKEPDVAKEDATAAKPKL